MGNQPRFYGLDRGQTAALLISECQSAIIDPEIAMFRELAEAVQSRDILRRINTLSACCRKVNVPVIHCTIRLSPHAEGLRGSSPLHSIMRRNKMLMADCPSSAIHPAVVVRPEDIVSDRSQSITAFHGSGLESVLLKLAVDTIILTGVSTNLALIGMSIEAVNRGFAVVIPEDCTAGASPELHAQAINSTLPNLATLTDSMAVITHLSSCLRPPLTTKP